MNSLVLIYQKAFERFFNGLVKPDKNRYRFHVLFTLCAGLVSWGIAFFTLQAFVQVRGYEWEYSQLLDVRRMDSIFNILGSSIVFPIILLVGFHRTKSKFHDGINNADVWAKIPGVYWFSYVAFTVGHVWLQATTLNDYELTIVYGMDVPIDPYGGLTEVVNSRFYGFRWEIITYLPYILLGSMIVAAQRETRHKSIKRMGVHLLAFVLLAIILHGGYGYVSALITSFFTVFLLNIFTDYFVPILFLNISLLFLLSLWVEYMGFFGWFLFENPNSEIQGPKIGSEEDLLDQV